MGCDLERSHKVSRVRHSGRKSSSTAESKLSDSMGATLPSELPTKQCSFGVLKDSMLGEMPSFTEDIKWRSQQFAVIKESRFHGTSHNLAIQQTE